MTLLELLNKYKIDCDPEVMFFDHLSLGESYMRGDWDCDNMLGFLNELHVNRLYYKSLLNRDFDVVDAVEDNLQAQGEQSQEVIDDHYELGNDLFFAMLDPTMTYTCGYFGDGAKTLEEAQMAKHYLIAQKLNIQKGDTVLDLGCGFGAFAEFAAQYRGAKVTGYTLSEKQAKVARKRSGLIRNEFGSIDIVVDDYRKAKGKYDHVVSLGMLEHVGYKNYRSFMKTAYRCLKDDGVALFQTIGNNVSQVKSTPWIDKHIFPNGMLPSITQLGAAMEGLFVMEDWHNFGPDYAKTCIAWFNNFDRNWPIIEEKYGEEFYRKWKFYLLNSAAGFTAREYQLWQVVMTKRRLEQPQRYD